MLAALLAIAALLFMTLGARGSWSFVLPFRGAKLAALLLVGVSVSTSTLLFQTISQNRILTPSIMGFDALYVLILTGAVFLLGGQTVAGLSDQAIFATTGASLIIASLALFGALLRRARADLLRLVLTGIVFGALFRSLASFLQRMIDPNEFAVIQVASYARFNDIETDLLAISAIVTGVALGVAWRMRHRLDVMALGYDGAVNLGEEPKRCQIEALILVAVLVSVATALVGPVAFLGLLVVSLARLITPSERHGLLFVSSGLISMIVLVAGQTALERIFMLSTPLSVVVDLLGGVVFLVLLIQGVRR